jgi:hypothetical protein
LHPGCLWLDAVRLDAGGSPHHSLMPARSSRKL